MRSLTTALIMVAVLTPALEPVEGSPPSRRGTGDLIDALGHPNPAARVEAAAELGRRGDPAGLIPLIKTLRDARPEVRAHAAEALRALGDERAVPFLSRLLEDRVGLVRCRALLALGDLAGRYAVPVITKRLVDPAAVVRAAAVRALGEIGEPLSLEAVIDAARGEGSDPDHAVRAAALVSAAKIAGSRGLGVVLEVVEVHLAGSWFLRATAAHAAGVVGDRSGIPALLAVLETDVDPRVCQAAAGAIARLGGHAELLGALGLPDAGRRQAAAVGLGEVAGAGARRGLMRAVRDESPGVVLAGASALLKRGEVDAIGVLIRLLSEEAQVWLGALEELELRTGRDYGRNPSRWESWFSEVREQLVFDPESGTYRVGAR